jgi:hypothetical protein
VGQPFFQAAIRVSPRMPGHAESMFILQHNQIIVTQMNSNGSNDAMTQMKYLQKFFFIVRMHGHDLKYSYTIRRKRITP